MTNLLSTLMTILKPPTIGEAHADRTDTDPWSDDPLSPPALRRMTPDQLADLAFDRSQVDEGVGRRLLRQDDGPVEP